MLQGENATQQLILRAKYSDGSVRDVTTLGYFFSNNDNSAKVTREGLITSAQRGEAFVMARFHTFTKVGVCRSDHANVGRQTF